MMQMPYAEMSVSTTDPRQAVQEMTLLLRKIKGITLTASGLKEMKNGYITSNYIKQQSSSAIAANLGKAEILGGWKYEDDFPAKLESVTPEQISKAFNKYIVGLRWSYLGNAAPAEQANEAFKQPLN
jgi:predicted Zn-dependent peptidase